MDSGVSGDLNLMADALSTFRGHVVIGQIGPLWGSRTKREMQLARFL